MHVVNSLFTISENQPPTHLQIYPQASDMANDAFKTPWSQIPIHNQILLSYGRNLTPY
jgi:hypothetical protein